MTARGSYRDLAGPFVFVAITLALTWASASVMTTTWTSGGSVATKLLRASLIYTAVVGWQPLAALLLVRRAVDPHWLDSGSRSFTPRYTGVAIVLPIILLLGAATVQALLGRSSGVPNGEAIQVTAVDAALAVCAFIAVLAVLWLQAIVEEIAWRGYLLPRVMRLLGPWPGLFLHGILWGGCYAPVFLASDSPGELLRIASFVVTCGLLGVLLGWLRLASGGVAASATCNATLTICAGLPLVLQGTTPLLGAVFEPAGWLPMLLLVAIIAARPSLRAVVVVPERLIPKHLN